MDGIGKRCNHNLEPSYTGHRLRVYDLLTALSNSHHKEVGRFPVVVVFFVQVLVCLPTVH